MVDMLEDLRGIKLPFDIDSVAPQCHDCIRKQVKKYEKHMDRNSKSMAGRFVVPCMGIPKDHIDPSLQATVDDEVWEEMLAAVDVVHWAAKYLRLPDGKPWIARWYQENVLRCTSRRKTLRIARRTGKTDAVVVDICYHLFTEPNIKLIVAGPQKTHTEEIINRVRSFISNNSELSSMVIRDVSAPYYEIKLSNGARVRGFAAGTKGKQQGVGIRGQDADRIYCEEMDYIDEVAIVGAILPILQTTPDTTLIGFSTPSGFKTPFYNLCENNPHYVEFHHNYKVLSHWKNIDMERSAYTEEMWTHEMLAEWGSAESGVYKPAYVDRALHSYIYADHTRGASWRYCIGVDWNEKHGTEIIVLGYNVITTKFQIVEGTHIQGSEFTQLSGVQAVLDANKKWRPSFVYIDAGAGATNYELLRQTAYKQRFKGGDIDTARLLDTLKRYNAGSSIVTKDPITSQEIRSPAKPFMVNASIRMFEQNRIIISSADTILESQLRNYIIVRYTPTKMPVYGLEDEKVKDHRLDALNLAIVAFHLEFDDLHRVRVVTSVGAVVDPRTGKSHHDNRDEQQAKAKQHTPEERRLDHGQQGSIGIMPARIDNASGIMKTNRAGWESDMESERRLEFLQRKRSRGGIRRNRPSRTTF